MADEPQRDREAGGRQEAPIFDIGDLPYLSRGNNGIVSEHA
jgi:hypothetical protein